VSVGVDLLRNRSQGRKEKPLDRYIDGSRQAIAAALHDDRPVAAALRQMYELVLSIYQPRDDPNRGCFMISTAVLEAMQGSDVRDRLAAAIEVLDGLVQARLARARATGEVAATLDPKTAAGILVAVIHTFAVRARAGAARKALLEIADAAIALVCGTQPLGHSEDDTPGPTGV
jgi:TetR/AcrR family transcriptional regulator, copper-responsive repressor